jgi:uncharacterized protein (TIRG00374 family)
MAGPWRKILFAILTLAVLAGLVIYSRGTMHQQFNWVRLARAVKAARLSYLILSVAAMFVAYAIRALRWQVFCRSLGPCSFLSVYSGTLMGYAALFVLGRAGEPIRPLLLARKCRFTISSMFGIWLLERLFDLGATAALLGLSLMLPSRMLATGEGAEWQTKFRATGVLLLAGVAGLLALVVYFRVHGAGALDRRLAGWRAREGWRSRLAGQFGGFSDGLQAIRSMGDLVLALAYSAAHWGLIAVVYLWIAQSFGGRLAEIDFRGALLVLIFTLVGSTVQLPGVGGGTQVLAFIAFTRIFGIEQEPAAAAAIVLWLISFAAVTAVGVPLLIHEGWSMADLRRLARSEAESEKARTHISAAADTPSGEAAAPEADRGGDSAQ